MFRTRSAWLWLLIPATLIVALLCVDARAHAWVSPALMVLTPVAGLAPAMDLAFRWLWKTVPHRAHAHRIAHRETQALWRSLGVRPSSREDLKVQTQAHRV